MSLATPAAAAGRPVARQDPLGALVAFVRAHPRLLVLTGAGCSTESGIPAYRDAAGAWRHRPPVRYADFVGYERVRQRYWSRSLLGWRRVERAQPNAAHRSLCDLEANGRLTGLITQNVDGLHHKAGSRRVLELHGRLDRVECLACAQTLARRDVQELLLAWNPSWRRAAEGSSDAPARPDGDAVLELEPTGFRVPDCPACGGLLKPAVVFFGENVPGVRVRSAMDALEQADGLLVVGSSLAVFSGYRFCLAARERRLPVAALNLGRTRADGLLSLKVEADCGVALARVAAELAPGRASLA